MFTSAQLTRITISSPQEIGGRMLPAGSVVDLRDDGRVKESFTPADQQDLARQREARRQQIRHCREICARVTDYGENARCTDNCKPR